MYYIKIVILFVLLMFILGVYSVFKCYYPIDNNKIDIGQQLPEFDRPFELNSLSNPKVVNETIEYATGDFLNTSQKVTISGRFQTVDQIYSYINNTNYYFVLGIKREDGVLVKIWLTESDYDIISNVVSISDYSLGKPIQVDISSGDLKIKNAF